MLFYQGCSLKEPILKESSQNYKQQDINISKQGSLLCYAYLKDGKELTKISKKLTTLKEGEEVVRIYQRGYYPLYDIYQNGKNCNSKNNSNAKKFCNSFYTQKDSVGLDTSLNVLASIFGLTLSSGFEYHKIFSQKNFKVSIFISNLPLIKKIVKNDNFNLLNIKSLKLNIKNIEKIKISDKFNSDIFILYDSDNNFKNIIDIRNLKKRDVFQATSMLTEQLINSYLEPIITMQSTNSNIEKIPKPKLPKKTKLIKREFETKIMFSVRVKKAMQQREKEIEKLQKKFRVAVEFRNKKVERLKELHQKNLEQIKQIEKEKKKNLKKYMPYFTSIAMQHIVGRLKLKNLRYDAENELMYADLYASNPNYSKKIYLKIPRNRAKSFKAKKNYQPIVEYDYSDNELILSDIEVDTYHAKLSEIDYKPKKIAVELKDKRIEINLTQNSFNLQNPNLKERYSVEGISYSEGVTSRVLLFQDDLPELLKKIDKHLLDNKKWLFVIGAEKYDNTDEVKYSKRSADIFAQVAQKTLGITERNSYKLIGNRATSGAIEDKLKLMLQNVKEGDSIYFYYSGHGIPVLPNRIPYLLPKDKVPDFISQTSFFKLSNIYTLLSNSKATKIIAIMDSCFSGSTDGKSVFMGVAGSVLIPKKVIFNRNKMVVLTAGREKQFSNMYRQRGHRLFSYFVMKALLEGKRNVKDVYNSVYPNVKSVSNGFGDLKRQEPTIEGNEWLSF